MLLFGLGQIDSTVFTQSSSSVVAIIFFTIYYFFIVFFVVTVFAGIYIDSYRLVVMQNGYNMGKDNELKLSGKTKNNHGIAVAHGFFIIRSHRMAAAEIFI